MGITRFGRARVLLTIGDLFWPYL